MHLLVPQRSAVELGNGDTGHGTSLDFTSSAIAK